MVNAGGAEQQAAALTGTEAEQGTRDEKADVAEVVGAVEAARVEYVVGAVPEPAVVVAAADLDRATTNESPFGGLMHEGLK